MLRADMRCIRAWLCTLLITAVLSASCLSANALSWLRGDADGDGEITSVDVTVIQRVLSGAYPDEEGMIKKRGAVTGDELSLPDATALQRYLALFSDHYHIGEMCTEEETQPPTEFVFPTQENQLPIIKV